MQTDHNQLQLDSPHSGKIAPMAPHHHGGPRLSCSGLLGTDDGDLPPPGVCMRRDGAAREADWTPGDASKTYLFGRKFGLREFGRVSE